MIREVKIKLGKLYAGYVYRKIARPRIKRNNLFRYTKLAFKIALIYNNDRDAAKLQHRSPEDSFRKKKKNVSLFSKQFKDVVSCVKKQTKPL